MIIRAAIALFSLTVWLAPNMAMCMGLIRDAQTEHYLRKIAAPIYNAAGLSPDQVRMFIVNDEALNAFVAGGSNMFLHTGIIIDAPKPDMLLGVIAHETGHITGGHLLRSYDYLKRARIGSVLTYILGAAAIAGGAGEAGAAILSGAGHASNRSMLAYTRTNERAADQAALRYFDTIGLSAEGMLLMFERLRRDERHFNTNDEDAYARTHPLTQERIAHIRAHLDDSPLTATLGHKIQEEHAIIRGKLVGFLYEPERALALYPPRDMSDAALVARAVMYSRQSDHARALETLDQLSDGWLDTPYINELRGYILFHAGLLPASATYYDKALHGAPDAALIQSDYGRTLLALGDEAALDKALSLLKSSAKTDPTYHQTWRLLSRLYGMRGEVGYAELSLAELAALDNDKEALATRLTRARELLSNDRQAMMRVHDLDAFLTQLNEKDE